MSYSQTIGYLKLYKSNQTQLVNARYCGSLTSVITYKCQTLVHEREVDKLDSVYKPFIVYVVIHEIWNNCYFTAFFKFHETQQKNHTVYKLRHLYFNVIQTKTHILNKICPIYPMYIHKAQLKVQCILDYMLLYKRADLWMQEITNEFLRPAFAVALYRAVYWHTELTY